MSTRYRWPPGLAALLALTAFAPYPARAACPLVEKIVTGTVLGEDGKPLAGVAVTATWDEKQAKQVKTQAVSGRDGRFELVIQYSTYSGRSFGGADRCEGTAPSADIGATLDGKSAGTRVDLGAEVGELKLAPQ